ncbi:MAG TPA: hypothetical protein VI522_02310 [Gammaproteobacteria bacterium]|nr:hypothetical protein [Gammaproteobacteria bacterium]
MNISEQQALLIIARHEWPDRNWRIQTFSDGHCAVDFGDTTSTYNKGSMILKLDHNTIEPIWNEWLDRVVTHFTEQSENLTKQDKIDPNDIRNWARANALNDLLKLSTPLDKANAIIEYWLAIGEITEEDIK